MPSNNQSNIIIYNSTDGRVSVSLYAQDGMVWMTQNQLAELFDTSKQNISLHVNNILENNELVEDSVVKEYLTTAEDGKDYATLHYSLEMIIAIGFKVKGVRETQFRIWANNNLKEYLLKGFVMDDERLKNPDGRPDYFDEFLAVFLIFVPLRNAFTKNSGFKESTLCKLYAIIMIAKQEI